MHGSVAIYDYHYASGTSSLAQPQFPVSAGENFDMSWDPVARVLRINRHPGSDTVFYCDDGWRFCCGSCDGAVLAACRAGRHQISELQPGCFVEVDALGASEQRRINSTMDSAQISFRRHKLKILALVPDAYGGHGGIARYNRDFFGALDASDEVGEIQVLPRQAGKFDEKGLPKKVAQFRPSFAKWIYTFRAALVTLRFRPHVLFCGHLHMTPLVGALSALFRIPMWVQVHGVEAFEKRGPLICWGIKQSHLVTVVSRYTRSKLLEWSAFPSDLVHVLPNTLDARFKPGNREHLKARHGYAGFKVILTVSRLDARERYKGHEQILAALPDLLQQYPQLIYLVAGDGSDRARLEMLAKTLNPMGDASASAPAMEGGREMGPRVRFLGRVNEVDLLELYQMADVFAMPSVGEGFGIVFLEAAACGCAVIGGSSDGSVDALAEGQIGAPVNPEDPAQVLQALRDALASPEPSFDRVHRFRQENFQHHLSCIVRRHFLA